MTLKKASGPAKNGKDAKEEEVPPSDELYRKL